MAFSSRKEDDSPVTLYTPRYSTCSSECAFGKLLGATLSLSEHQERLSDLMGPYWGTYGMVYRVLQPLLAQAQTLVPHQTDQDV